MATDENPFFLSPVTILLPIFTLALYFLSGSTHLPLISPTPRDLQVAFQLLVHQIRLHWLPLHQSPSLDCMAAEFHGLEPFPLFIDSDPPADANYFSAMHATFNILSSTSTPHSGKPRTSVSTKLNNYLRLRYYQYEATFGLYMMTSREKYILNVIILTILAAFSYAMYIGIQTFVIRMLCRMLFYITGSLAGAGELCSQ